MKKSEQATYKSRLIELRKRLMRAVDAAEEALRDDIATPGTLSNVPPHPADRAVEGADEQIAIAQNEEQLLADTEAALERIEAGTFGLCQNCGREIGHDRLSAIPYTSWCIECAQKIEPTT